MNILLIFQDDLNDEAIPIHFVATPKNDDPGTYFNDGKRKIGNIFISLI